MSTSATSGNCCPSGNPAISHPTVFAFEKILVERPHLDKPLVGRVPAIELVAKPETIIDHPPRGGVEGFSPIAKDICGPTQPQDDVAILFEGWVTSWR